MCLPRGERPWLSFWARRFLKIGSTEPKRPRVSSATHPCLNFRQIGNSLGDRMNARNRVFMILGLLTLGSLVWYLLTARTSGDLKLIGTVDANEVLVSAKIPGRIQTLNVDEGQTVKAGDLIAIVESDDLAAQQKAAEANVQSNQSKLAES